MKSSITEFKYLAVENERSSAGGAFLQSVEQTTAYSPGRITGSKYSIDNVKLHVAGEYTYVMSALSWHGHEAV